MSTVTERRGWHPLSVVVDEAVNPPVLPNYDITRDPILEGDGLWVVRPMGSSQTHLMRSKPDDLLVWQDRGPSFWSLGSPVLAICLRSFGDFRAGESRVMLMPGDTEVDCHACVECARTIGKKEPLDASTYFELRVRAETYRLHRDVAVGALMEVHDLATDLPPNLVLLPRMTRLLEVVRDALKGLGELP